VDASVSPECQDASAVLYRLPLGAGGRSVRINGQAFEALAARREGCAVRELYHSALEVRLGATRFVIEMAPVWSGHAAELGVVAEGPVGARWLGRFAAFRYEVRCWRRGVIDDSHEAVASPRLIGQDAGRARLLVRLVPLVPVLTWGRDELRLGEMWNSNSLISWLLARSDHPAGQIDCPPGGRAPGWSAGLRLAQESPGVSSRPPAFRSSGPAGPHTTRRPRPRRR
jgi:hypothetical protein